MLACRNKFKDKNILPILYGLIGCNNFYVAIFTHFYLQTMAHKPVVLPLFANEALFTLDGKSIQFQPAPEPSGFRV